MNDEFSRLKTIFDNAPIGIFLSGFEGRLVNLNNQMAKIFGYDSIEDALENVKDVSKDIYVDPEDRKRIFEESKDKNTISSFELKFKKKNGQLIDARISIRPYKSPDFDTDYFIGIVEDITEQKNLIKEVKISENKYRSLFENSNDAIYIVNSDNNIEFNTKAKEIFEIPPHINTLSMEAISPEYQPDGQLSSEKANFHLQKVLNGEPQKFEWFGHTFKDRPVYCDVSMTKLNMGDDYSLMVVVRDITERKMSELKLVENENKYRSLFENSNDAIYILHSDNELEINNKAREIFELPPHVKQFTIEEISPEYQPDGRLSSEKINYYTQKILTGEAQKFEWLCYTFTGREVYCEVNLDVLIRENKSSIIAVVRDITDKKKSEKQLIESEYKYRSLFEKSNDAIFIINEKTIIEFNDKARELFEVPSEKKTIGFSDLHVENQQDGKKAKDLVKKYSNEDKSHQSKKIEWILKSFSGKKLHCEVSISPIVIEKKNYLLAMVRDITNRKKAEKKLIESEKRYRHLVDNAPIGIVRTKLNGEIVFVNNKMLDILGFKNVEEALKLYPKMPSVYKNSEDREAFLGELEKGETVNSKVFVKGKSKEQHLVNFIAAPEINSKGDVEFINSIVEDIGEKERLENKIIEREETLSSVVNSFPFELVVTDKENNLLVQNRYSKRFFGDLEGNTVEKILIPGETKEIWDKHAKEVFSNKVLDYEREAIRNKRSNFFRIIKAPLIINDEVTGVIAMSINITDRKRLQQEIENHRDNLEELVKKRTVEVKKLNKKLLLTNEELYATNDILSIQKSELEDLVEELKQTQNQLIMSEKMASIGILTAGIAHEINNPVNFISSGLTGLELIIKDILDVLSGCRLTCDPQKVDNNDLVIKKAIDGLPKLIDSMRNGIHRTTEIVKGLRTFSRLDNENKSLSNVNELIDSGLVILTNKYKYKIKIEKNYTVDYPINCYPGKLSQVFLNLIVNAIHAIKDKGQITITTESIENGKKIVIKIKDDGEGIPEEIKNKIFDPFFTTKSVGEGTGLGLAIVHGIIQEHEGNIEVISEINKGAEFIITLPVD